MDVADSGMRMDEYIAKQCPQLSRSAAARLIEGGQVFVFDKPAVKSYKIRPGDEIEMSIPKPVADRAIAQDIALDVVFEDADLLVVNKPQGMVVHPCPGHPDGTLVNALLSHCEGTLSGIGGVSRPGIVHRIDKDTSGLLIVAKNDLAHYKLSQQIKQHSFLRIYAALLHGYPKNGQGTVCAPIGRHPQHRKKMAIIANGKEAITHYRVVERFLGFSLTECRLETGRTHQIRVHMASLGCPVAGDPVYGPKKAALGLQGQCLHAKIIGFVHPKTGEWLEFHSPLPPYFMDTIAKLSPYGK